MQPIYLQKAMKFNPKVHDIRGFGIQRKLDGVRVQLVIDSDGKCRIYSRSKTKATGSFNEYTEKLPHIVSTAEQLDLKNTILDGEACVFKFETDQLNYAYVSGTLNMKAEKCLATQQEQELIKVVIFDVPTMDEPYRLRYKFLMESIVDEPRLSLNPMIINKGDEYMVEFNKIVNSGGEGIILYDMYAKYKHSNERCQVSKHVLKIKGVNECELLVVAKEEGLGKCSGTLGALVCKDGEGKTVRVGTGMTDEERRYLMTIPTPFVIEITYQEKTEDSYRHPAYYRLRLDKDADSWNKGDDDNTL